MSDQKPKKPDSSAAFLHDSETSDIREMPSITTLMARKKLAISNSSEPPLFKQDKPAAPPPPPGRSPSKSPPPPPTGGPTFSRSSTPSHSEDRPLFETEAEKPAAKGNSDPEKKTREPQEISIVMDVGEDIKFETRNEPQVEVTPLTNEEEIREPKTSSGILFNPSEEVSEPSLGELSHGIEAVAAQPQPALPALKVQRARRREEHPGGGAKALVKWEINTLRASADPMGAALVGLLQQGVESAAFLAIAPPPPGAKAPVFVATAAVGVADKFTFWQGLTWDPALVPDLWNTLVKTGYVELAPPGPSTVTISTRNVVRAAFGARDAEYLTLVRVGSATACRGALVLISTMSLTSAVEAAIPTLSLAPPRKVA